MIYFKKLILAPIFLIVFSFTCFKLNSFFLSSEILFSLSNAAFIQLLLTSMLILLSSVLYVLFATFATDWKIITPITFLSGVFPLIFTAKPLSWVLSIGFTIVFLLAFLNLREKLKSYLTFQPSNTLSPTIKTLSTLLVFITSFAFYLSTNAQVKQTGFSIPDSLIDSVLKAMPQPDLGQAPQELSLPKIDKEQLAVLKQNPGLLSQYNLDPKMLDLLEQNDTKNILKDTAIEGNVKNMVKSQIDSTLKPYLSFIAPFLAVTFFFTINWIVSMLALLLTPLLNLIFHILTKTGFATFTTEMREVKKLTI